MQVTVLTTKLWQYLDCLAEHELICGMSDAELADYDSYHHLLPSEVWRDVKVGQQMRKLAMAYVTVLHDLNRRDSELNWEYDMDALDQIANWLER